MEADQVGRLLEAGAGCLSTALSLDDYNAGPSRYLALIEKARASLEIPVIARRNGVAPGAWVDHAGLLEEAGADALELNVDAVSSSPKVSGAEVEERYLELVGSVRQRVGIPLAVKLSPYVSAVANLTRQLVQAGADGLVLETLEVTPRLVLSTSDELRLPLRWIAILYKEVPASLAASTGVHTAADVETVGHLRGMRSQRSVRDPEAWERANYITMLAGYPDQAHTEAR
jgi:dihydroorotate dehydrogenase (fumarate)